MQLHRSLLIASAFLLITAGLTRAADVPPVGIVSHIKVLSDKVRDVSSIEAWKSSFIRDDMTDERKAQAIFRSVAMFRYQDPPPIEFLGQECVHDPIKTFNVYGYGMCCCATANVEALARYVGLEARGQTINQHSVPEVSYGGAWHMVDSSLVNYFPKPDGQVASVAEIEAAVKAWYDAHPGYKGNPKKLDAFHRAGGWLGWKQGPELLAKSPFYDWGGWWPARTHGWMSTMQEYDGTHNTPFVYEQGYSQGYEVNLRLRPGERLTRNWFNKGLHVNGILHDGGEPGCMKETIGKGPMAYLTGYGDVNTARIGSGTIEYRVPLDTAIFASGVVQAENLRVVRGRTSSSVEVVPKDPAKPGVLEVRMPSSYVYLAGEAAFEVGRGSGKIQVLFSDNNGLDWRSVSEVTQAGPCKVDLQKQVLRRYDYRLRFVLSGAEASLADLRITGTLQCSQRALPTLVQGENTITFAAGKQEGTITIEGAATTESKGKNVTLADFHPTLEGLDPQFYRVKGGTGSVTLPIATPGDMTRLRLGGFYRARDKGDGWDVQVSFDNGRTFKSVAKMAGPVQGSCVYTVVKDVPSGTRAALVRFAGKQRNTTCLFSARIDADYREPAGGFQPVQVTYMWRENGVEKRDVHVATHAEEKYKIVCAGKPEMRNIVLELAE